MKWYPIETVPKTLKEIIEVNMKNGHRFKTTLMIARVDQPFDNGVIAGYIGEFELSEDGKWVTLQPNISTHGEFEYGEIVEPTHWGRIPRMPANKK